MTKTDIAMQLARRIAQRFGAPALMSSSNEVVRP